MQAGDGRPSYDELAALVARQAATIARLEAEVAALRAENAELKRRLGMNWRNSSKPPSSDSPFVKPAPKSLRRRSGRKPGGQAGHPGSTLAQVAEPDEVRRHEPGPCGGCGVDLSTAPQVGVERRQVFDLPPIRVRVTEHQLITRRCGCGTSTCAAAPSGVAAPVQYGPGRRATEPRLARQCWPCPLPTSGTRCRTMASERGHVVAELWSVMRPGGPRGDHGGGHASTEARGRAFRPS